MRGHHRINSKRTWRKAMMANMPTGNRRMKGWNHVTSNSKVPTQIHVLRQQTVSLSSACRALAYHSDSRESWISCFETRVDKLSTWTSIYFVVVRMYLKCMVSYIRDTLNWNHWFRFVLHLGNNIYLWKFYTILAAPGWKYHSSKVKRHDHRHRGILKETTHNY